jgi:hypothetical protein
LTTAFGWAGQLTDPLASTTAAFNACGRPPDTSPGGGAPGRTQTMPLAVYVALESDPEAAVALSLVLLIVSIAVLAGLRDRWLTAGAAP